MGHVNLESLGHVNLESLSEMVVRRIYARGKVSIKDLTDFSLKRGFSFTRREEKEDWEEFGMNSLFVSEVIWFYLCDHKYTPRGEATPVLVPHLMTIKQKEIFHQWKENSKAFENWNANFDDPNSQYNIFHSILWSFASGWRKRYPDLPLLGYFEM